MVKWTGIIGALIFFFIMARLGWVELWIGICLAIIFSVWIASKVIPAGDYRILLTIVLSNVLTSQIGQIIGYTISGSLETPSMSTENPGSFGVLEWIWDSIVFLINMSTFQIEGVPAIISVVFLAGDVMLVYLIIKLVRGTS